jgi:hypothetical protein
MNGVVIGLGALVLGVPLVVPIALVNFVTSYIPFYGAFFAGAFAVLVALGANGLSVAVAMLAITLLTNNTLQNLLEPLVLGKTLRLHPLVVMLVTTPARCCSACSGRPWRPRSRPWLCARLTCSARMGSSLSEPRHRGAPRRPA